MASRMWLGCSVSPGQFTEEYAISARDYNGNHFSLFVSKKFVEHGCADIADGVECEGRLIVTVLKIKNDLALVQLPGRTFENGSIVTVREDQLATAEPSHT